MGIWSALFGRDSVVAHALAARQAERFNNVIGPGDVPGFRYFLDAVEDPLTSVAPIPRDQAIQVPAVKRVRDLIAGSIGQLPLGVYDSERVPLVNDLLPQPERNKPRTVTITQTVEDMLFGDGRTVRGIAWWRVVERAWDKYPRYVERIAPHRVQVNDATGEIRIDGKVQRMVNGGHPDLIRFDSPNDALLVAGARAIRAALKLDQTAAQYADDPQAREYFTAAEGEDPDDDDVEEALSDWKAARMRRSFGYVPPWLQLQQGTMISPRDLQLVDARQQATLGIAVAANVDPEELGVSTTSRIYANQFERRKAFIDFTLGPFLKAIEERLSMGDVTKRGNYVRFNLDTFLRSDAETRYRTYQLGLQVGAIGKSEIRPMEEKPELTPGDDVSNSQQPAQSVAASKFSDATELELTAPPAVARFKVDQASRTITGMIVPFSSVGITNGQRWTFTKESFAIPEDVTRVKLLMDHDFRQAVGYATKLDVQADGIYGTFQLDDTPEADRALAKARGKVYDGMSVGLGYGGELTMLDDETATYKDAPLLETSLTPLPAFADARVTTVAASAAKEGNTMKCTKCDAVHAAGVTTCDPAVLAAFTAAQAAATPAQSKPAGDQPPTFSAEQHAALLALLPKPKEEPKTDGPQVISASAGHDMQVTESLPYTFDRGGNFAPDQEHVFSADLHAMADAHDTYGVRTDAGKRVMGLLAAAFAVDTGAINELNPTIQRPDMYVDQRDYRTPLWDFVNKGAPPNGVQPFIFPKFNTATGLVGDHTEGTEPDSGTFTTTDQTVTPTAISGKASITREVWDMGGNPAVSGLIFNQMRRGWREGLETATATFLNTLTAATDITLAAGSADDVLAAAWDDALVDLQFIRGYDFEAFALEKVLYKAFSHAVDADGRRLFPILNPQNANGTAAARFRTLDLSGVTGVPSWALPSTAGTPNNSWLFDPATVHGWASQPTRLEFPGTDATGGYAPVAMVDLAIWGYKAFANSDIGGVRQVIYDSVA